MHFEDYRQGLALLNKLRFKKLHFGLNSKEGQIFTVVLCFKNEIKCTVWQCNSLHMSLGQNFMFS